jgi:hypothetical protein
VGEDGCRLIGSLLLAGLWQATTARARIPEPDRLDAAVFVDECHNFLHLPIGLDDALAEARGLRTSFVLAHQYLGQLSDEMAQAIDANARNKVYFALSPRDARDQSHHVAPYLDDGDLMRLGGFEVALRPVAHGRTIPPTTADTLAPPSPEPGRADELRAAARRHTGLPEAARRRLLVEDPDPDPDPEPDAADLGDRPQQTPSQGTNTFDGYRNGPGVGSDGNPHGASHGMSHGDEHAGEHAALNSVFGLFNDDEEEPWTGTD